MNKFLFTLCILIFYCDVTSCASNREFIEFAEEIGLTATKEEVITKDGYILNVFHIPGEKGPVLLQHGLTDSADTFILRRNNSHVAFLAENGYEIFVGNFRGNKYCKGHVVLNSEIDKDFWNFTMNEHAMYDMPALVDHILNVTGKKDLIVIGHSEGTSVFYALCSSQPEYNDKIKVLISLAPICYLNNIPPPVSALIKISPIIYGSLKSLGIVELGKEKSTLSYLFTIVCHTSPQACGAVLFLFAGADCEEIDKEFIKNEVAMNYPSATSTNNLYHLAQLSLSKRFQKFDYGVMENLNRYGSATPPEYNLSKITMQVELLVGKNDKVSTIENVKHLSKKLKNNNYKEIKYEKMDHYDFVWGKHMRKYLFNEIFHILKKL